MRMCSCGGGTKIGKFKDNFLECLFRFDWMFDGEDAVADLCKGGGSSSTLSWSLSGEERSGFELVSELTVIDSVVVVILV